MRRKILCKQPIYLFIFIVTFISRIWGQDKVESISITDQSLTLSEKGFYYLTLHQTSSAENAFKESIRLNPKNRDALLGSSILDIYRADYDKAFQRYKSILLSEPDSLENEMYIRRLGEFQTVVPDYPSLIPLYEKLLSDSAGKKMNHPYLKTLISEFLYRLYKETGNSTGAFAIEKSTGYISNWDYVMGPFGKTGISDLNRIFPPEKDLSLNRYPGWIHPVEKRAVRGPLSLGELRMDDYIYPAKGTGYAVTRFHSNTNRDGWVGIYTNQLAKVWVNGNITIIRDFQSLQNSESNWSNVHLQKGGNQIVVKLVSLGGNMSFRMQLLDNEGIPVPVEVLIETRTNNRIGNKLSSATTVQINSTPPFGYTSKDVTALPSMLTQFMLSVLQNNFTRGEKLIRDIQAKYPDWGYPDLILGDMYMRQSREQSQSSHRLSNQAKELFEKARKKMPDVPGSYYGLARYYLNQRQYDTALEFTRQSEKIASNSYLVPVLYSEIYSQKEWSVDLEQSLIRTTTLNSRYPYAWYMLAGQKENNGLFQEGEKLIRQALQMDYTSRQTYFQLRTNLNQQGKYKECLDWMNEYFQQQPQNYQDLIALGQEYEKLNQPEQAFKYYSMATISNPDHPDGFNQLAEFELLKGNREKAIQLFQQAINKAPFRDELKDRLRLLKDEDDFYKPYDIPFESVDTTGYDSEKYPRAAAIYLLDLMVTEYQLDGSTRSMIHQSIKILNKEGRSRFEELVIPTHAKIISARTLTSDGKIYKPTIITPTSSGKTLSMQAVEEGSVLDYCYVFSEGGGRSPGDNHQQGLYFFQEKEDPMNISRAVYIVPDGLYFDYRKYPNDFLPTITEDTIGLNRKIYQWEKRESKGVKEEPYMPPQEDVVVNVYTSTYPDWESVITPILEGIEVSLIPSIWIEETTKTLLTDITNQFEKLQKIYDFVTQKITPGSSGGGTATDTLLVGSGTSFDKTILAKTMLDEADIRSELILVSAAEIPESKSGIPLPGQYTRLILYLPDFPMNYRYLDLSSQYRPLGQISESIQGKDAIRITKDGFEFITIPDSSMANWQKSLSFRITINPDSTCKVEGNIRYSDENAVALRDYLIDPIRKKQVLDEQINRLFRGINISTSFWTGLEEISKPVSIVFDGKVNNLLIPREQGFAMTSIFDKLNLSRLVPSPEREHPLHINNTVEHSDYELELFLPDNIRLSEIPNDLLEINLFGKYQSSWTSLSDNHWLGKRSVMIPKLKISPERYPDFLSFCQKIDLLEKQQLFFEFNHY